MLQKMPPVTWVDDPETMMKFVRHVRDTKECAMDTETTGLDRWRDHVMFWSASPDDQSRYCFSRRMLDIYDEELARDRDLTWYFTNQTFDFCMLANSGVLPPEGDSYCTLAMDWLIDENVRHGLKETAYRYLDLEMAKFKDVFKGKTKDESIQDRLVRAMKENFIGAISYASADAYATYRVFKAQKKLLQKQNSSTGMNLWDYFQDVEMPFTRVLYNMCRRGIMVDVGYLNELSPQLEKSIAKATRTINKMAGKEMNPNSTQQLRVLLFEKMGLEPVRMTKGGASGVRSPSTDEATLRVFADQGVDIVKHILELRSLVKTKGTYVDGMSKWLDTSNRIHATLTQHVTVTGRLSSVDPNLQNIPRPDKDKFGLRHMFMPKDGHILVVADYEQLEMRIMAHCANEQNMIDVILKGWDIHTGTASLMYDFKYEDIIAAVKKKKVGKELSDREMEMIFARQASKTIGFGLNYGEGPRKLGLSLGITDVEEAKALIDKYFEPYPSVRQYIRDVHTQVRHEAVVETVIGRPRRFPEMEFIGRERFYDLPGDARKLIAQMERQSVNSIIQGSAADIAKQAMIICEYDHDLKRLGAELLLQIHDELIFEVPEENAKEAVGIIKKLMAHPLSFELKVPLTAEAGIGLSWASAKA
jgi:DNA polymerase-1